MSVMGFPDSVKIFREWLNRSFGYVESGEVYGTKPGTLCELKFVWVEDYPCSADDNEVIYGPKPMILQLNIPVNGVIDASLLALEVSNDLTNSAIVPITR